jgi:hypothetical protein
MSAPVLLERLKLRSIDPGFWSAPDKPVLSLNDIAIAPPAGHLLEFLKSAGWLQSVAAIPAPPQADGTPGVWGYIACDGETLFGSLARPEVKVRHNWKAADMNDLFSESSAFFAIDTDGGKLRWRYDAQQSIRHNAIAIGSGRVYLIDRPIAESDKWDPRADAKAKPPAIKQPLGRLVAIDIKSGKTAWTNDQDIFGTLLAYQADQDALLMSYQSTRFKLPSEVGGRIAMHRGATGERVWEKEATYVTRPLINGGTIYAQGGSWDLATGADRPFDRPRQQPDRAGRHAGLGRGIGRGGRRAATARSALATRSARRLPAET